MYRFGKQRYGMFWGIVGKMDWMSTILREDRQTGMYNCTSVCYRHVDGKMSL